MTATLSTFLTLLAKGCGCLMVANEVRGLILTAPVFYGLYQAGGTLMAIWLALCSLGGIALSVVVPLIAVRKLERLAHARAELAAK